MQVMLEAFHAGQQQAAERFDSYAPCGAENGAGLSVRIFLQLGVLACAAAIRVQTAGALDGRSYLVPLHASDMLLDAAGGRLRVAHSGSAGHLCTCHAVEEVGPAHIAAAVKAGRPP